MSRCCFCAQEIEDGKYIHTACAKKLFGLNVIPLINLSLTDISAKTREMAGKLSISGVQAKLSVKLDKKEKELIVAAEKGEYILKPHIDTFPQMPENENLCMSIAGQLGINIPPHALIRLKDNSYAYIVKRFDRKNGDKLFQEDFCQILQKPTKEKYDASVEQIAKKLKSISEVPGLDVQHLYERALFFFIIGNGDSHLKNFSISYSSADDIRLSPAYDIVSSKLIIPNEDDFALTINGKKNKLNIKDFIAFADSFNIPEKITKNILDKKELIISLIKDSQLSVDYRRRLTEIVLERFSRLGI